MAKGSSPAMSGDSVSTEVEKSCGIEDCYSHLWQHFYEIVAFVLSETFEILFPEQGACREARARPDYRRSFGRMLNVLIGD